MGVAEFVAENFLKSATNEEKIKNISKILESENTKNRWKYSVFLKTELPQNFLWEFVLEQGTGVEPASEAWEATIIADILTLHGLYYSKQYCRIQAFFVTGLLSSRIPRGVSGLPVILFSVILSNRCHTVHIWRHGSEWRRKYPPEP